MPDAPRYLLGKAERLTRPVTIVKGGGPKAHIYEWAEQRERLAPQAAQVARTISELPSSACPEDRSVGVLTLHPTYFAKSYFPDDLLRECDLRAVGSRPVTVKPDKGNPGVSTAIFIAGKRDAFKAFAENIPRRDERNVELLTIETLRVPTPEERMRLTSANAEQTLEVILHAPSGWDSVIEGFDEFLEELGFAADVDRRHYIQDLCFMPVRVRTDRLHELGQYSFLRVARTMPRLREMRPAAALSSIKELHYSLPEAAALDAGIRVAILDGGLSKDSPLNKWATAREGLKVGPALPDFEEHGTDVTSAALFGTLTEAPPPPYFNVDHYRVLDKDSLDPDGQYYDVLDRIVDVLGTQHYDFVNLSLGPHLPIEDDEIHPWTAKLDEILAEGKTLLVSAVGNDGELDRAAGLARIQPPSDAVNLLSVGSATLPGAGWARAPYSCIGPGRSPGVTKPDIMSFGGSADLPFLVAGAAPNGAARSTCGTSFAAPNAIRVAAGLRAHFGAVINPLAIRALLVHHADASTHAASEVGWGAIPADLRDLVECPPGTAYVLYQGMLEPRQYLRADIPMPAERVEGDVTIRATFCIATDVDPEDSSNYTRSGLVPTFRPDKDKRTPYWDKRKKEMREPLQPDAEGFFKISDFETEQELREDALKWETVLRKERTFKGARLKDPMFDVHYNPREGGADASNPRPIPYALVVTISAKDVPDLYDRIATRYRTQLEALQPVIEIPIRIEPQDGGAGRA